MAFHKVDETMPTLPIETTIMSEEDRRMGLGTSSQKASDEPPVDCLDLHLPSDQSEITGAYSRSEVAERSEEHPESVETATQPEIQPELAETPIKLSTQKTIRINRRNFRSPAVSMIPTGTVEISEGELSPVNDNNGTTETDNQNSAENTPATENNKEDMDTETTVEPNNNKQIEIEESPEVTGEAGNGIPLNKPFTKLKPLLDKTHHESENPCRRSHRIKNAKRVLKYGGISYM